MDLAAVHLRAGALRAAGAVCTPDALGGDGGGVPQAVAHHLLDRGRVYGGHHRPARGDRHRLCAQPAAGLGDVGGRGALGRHYYALPDDAALGDQGDGGHHLPAGGADKHPAAGRVGQGGHRRPRLCKGRGGAGGAAGGGLRRSGRARRRGDATQPLPAHGGGAEPQGAAHGGAHPPRRLSGQRGTHRAHPGDHHHQHVHYEHRGRENLRCCGPRYGRAAGGRGAGQQRLLQVPRGQVGVRAVGDGAACSGAELGHHHNVHGAVHHGRLPQHAAAHVAARHPHAPDGHRACGAGGRLRHHLDAQPDGQLCQCLARAAAALRAGTAGALLHVEEEDGHMGGQPRRVHLHVDAHGCGAHHQRVGGHRAWRGHVRRHVYQRRPYPEVARHHAHGAHHGILLRR
mmetsp:Transcript_2937/g.8952  ORF Transcript_2937/g.8952 Transcript_2937/m.8952 type:complete len:400 (-) Transcript_2937:148-1347(-)